MVQRSMVMLLMLSLVSCVGDDPAPTSTLSTVPPAAPDAGPDKADRFVGTWSTAAATQTLSNCPAAGTLNNISISLEVKKGTTSDILAINSLAPSCLLRANVVGETATFVDGQTCTATFANGTDTYTYAGTSTFKLTSAGGAQATMTLNATITSSLGGTCSFTEVAPYTKR